MTRNNPISAEGVTLWTVPAGPATWVMEPGNGPVGGPLAVSVSDLRVFLDTLTAAGLTVAVSRYPQSETVSYLHADRGGVSLIFRHPNKGEVPSALAAVPADDFVRIDAGEYRYLADEIGATMDDPDRWDGDDAESYILAQYVKWLANGRPVTPEGDPDMRSNAEARRPDPYKALTVAAGALDLADSYFESPDDFALSMQGVLERVRDNLAEIRDALIGHPAAADPDGAQSAPVPGEVYRHRQDDYRIVIRQVDPAAGIARTSGTERTEPIGRVHFSELATDFERVGSIHGPDDTEAFRATLAAAFPYISEPCRYSAVHLAEDVSAVTVLDCGPAGRIPACQACADLYARLSGQNASQQAASDNDSEHEHHFPLPADADTDPAMEPGDCTCGMTYVEYDAQMGERIAADLESRHGDAGMVIHDLDGSGGHAADCSGCEIEPVAGPEPQSPDVPQTVTVYDNGVPVTEIKVGDAGSARAVASTYERRGKTVEIRPTEN